MHGCSFATECNNPPGSEKTCLWSVTIRILSSLFSLVPLIVPRPYLILELATHKAAASAVQVSMGHGFLVCNTQISRRWRADGTAHSGYPSVVQWDFTPFTFRELC